MKNVKTRIKLIKTQKKNQIKNKILKIRIKYKKTRKELKNNNKLINKIKGKSQKR